MGSKAWWGLVCGIICALLAVTEARAQSATLAAPPNALAGSKIQVTFTGPNDEGDHIGIVEAGAPDDTRASYYYEYVRREKQVQMLTPEQPGQYEIRYITGENNTPLARIKLTLTPLSATLKAPATALAGSAIVVSFSGPNNDHDHIGIVEAGAPDDTRADRFYQYVHRDKQVQVLIPEQPGQYEIRYITGGSNIALARQRLTVSAASATLKGPGTALAGSTIAVSFSGPNNDHDHIGIVETGAPDDTRATRFYECVGREKRVQVICPEQAGKYEIRYITGGTNIPLARDALIVTAASASLDGPPTAAAGSRFDVAWKGPGNPNDYIAIAPKGEADETWAEYAYVGKRSPSALSAPLNVGAYELRYVTGQTHTVLARADLRVTPAKQEPGLVRVTLASAGTTGGPGGAVELILDASGSVLQRLGSERRIDIAKRTLTNLTARTIPAGTPFALRVFGRQADSCQTDLDIPLGPLDAAAAAAKIAALEAKNGAKTPIGASLEKVADDLRSATGERLVVLVTDGEETCGGNPSLAIQRLQKAGLGVRVNIVGFALDDDKLAATFRLWSDSGNGAFFDARDAAGLDKALTNALRPSFEILDAKKDVVASGMIGAEPARLLPGTYTVRLQGQKARSRSVTVRSKETVSVDL